MNGKTTTINHRGNSGKGWLNWSIAILVPASLLVTVWTIRDNLPRQSGLRFVEGLCEKLSGSDSVPISDGFVVPVSLQAKKGEERELYLREVLRNEVSVEGLQALRRGGRFGSLSDVFPEKAEVWASLFKVPVGECFAYRMDRDGLTAELILHRGPGGWRVLRCNNVSQMALAVNSTS